ncbi:MAG: nucleotidyl transferase AbiEii/AbiGii toxin family protein [Proteobacteria bacterium]|nr:nucleotidyl transferase AbiEii/AbiGii toxin family protein [Pseudomonadota bacterium]
MGKRLFFYPHAADFDIFRECLASSEAATGFTATLIEKDYYCSLILQYLFAGKTSLVFKGGTCLSKVYTDFYRLSEDLDFVIPIVADASRNQRQTRMKPVKRMIEDLPEVIPGVSISELFRGHNESRQYIGYIEYRSAVIERQEKVKLEVGLREPLLSPPEAGPVRTIVINPFLAQPVFSLFTVRAMSLKELYAEKVRAALTRKEPAIRDFFDLFYAAKKMKLDFLEPDFLRIVKAKLDVPGNDPLDVSSDRKQEIDKQLNGRLKPVLRPGDIAGFDLNEAFALVCAIVESVKAQRL